MYEYKCRSCSGTFESLRSMSRMREPLEESCPACGVPGMIEQAPTTAGFIDPIRLGRKRPNSGFTEAMTRLKQNHPLGNFNTNHGMTGIV